ncbi:MAG: hypothetical protein NVSMB2_13430 [Chloroflexota bacterium]
MPVRFVLVKLKAGVSSEDYEQFIQTIDYPVVPSLRTIVDYRTNRIRPEDKDPATFPWDYMERIVVTDVAAYRDELAQSVGFAEFRRLNPNFVETTRAFWADTVEPEGQA